MEGWLRVWIYTWPQILLLHIHDTIFFVYLNNLTLVSVAIRGDHQDEAVLCTDKATFDLKVAETSNSLLLVRHCALPKDEGNLFSLFSLNCLFILAYRKL